MSRSPADRSWRSLLDPGDANDFFACAPPAFPLVASRFHRPTACFLADLTRLIYQNQPDRRRTTVGRAGLVEVSFVESGPVSAGLFVAAKGGLGTVLVFRGTASLLGWMTNLDVRPAEAAIGGKVHRGFLDAWLHAAVTVRACLKALPRPLTIAGHSLGGALTVLAMNELDADLAYSFGAPKVGDAAFAARFERRRLYRVVHGRDIVPTLPPGRAYRHVGTPKKVGTGLLFRAGATLREAKNAVRGGRLEELRRTLKEAPEPLSDHAPINYVRALS